MVGPHLSDGFIDVGLRIHVINFGSVIPLAQDSSKHAVLNRNRLSVCVLIKSTLVVVLFKRGDGRRSVCILLVTQSIKLLIASYLGHVAARVTRGSQSGQSILVLFYIPKVLVGQVLQIHFE